MSQSATSRRPLALLVGESSDTRFSDQLRQLSFDTRQACGADVEGLLAENEFDLAVLDIETLPGGLRLLRQFREQAPASRLIIHSSLESFELAREAIDAGAIAYVIRAAGDEELIRHARRAIAASGEASSDARRFQQLLSDMDAFVWESDIEDWRCRCFDPKPDWLLGYPAQRWTNEPDLWVNCAHPDDRQTVVDHCKAAAEGADQLVEYRVAAADGRLVWVRDFVYVARNAAGRPVGLRGVVFDITRRRLAERSLQISEQQRQRTESFAHIMTIEIEIDGRWRRPSRALCQLLGYEERELTGRPRANFVHEEDYESERRRIDQLLAKQVHSFECETRMFSKGGEIVWVYANWLLVSSPSGPQRFHVYMRDITEQKIAQQRLMSSEASLARAQRIGRMGSWERDLVTGKLTATDTAFEISGLPPGSYLDDPAAFIRAHVHPDDQQQLLLLVEDAKTPFGPVEFRLLRDNQSVRHLRVETELETDDKNQPVRICGTIQDLTELITVEQALRESEERFRLVSKATRDAIYDWTTANNNVWRNEQCAEMFRLPNEAGSFHGWVEMIHPSDRQRVQDGLAAF